MRGFFVTGTDTGAGKTVLSAALTIRLHATYWKPIQTGPDDDTAEVKRLSGCSVLHEGIRLPDPVSPHLAAQRAGTKIDLGALAAIAAKLEAAPMSIVEGAGGVLVPVQETATMADFMKLLDLPVIVAARSSLGTINHTLLTLEALRTRSIRVAGVVMIGEYNADNRSAVARYGNVKVLAEMPRFDPLSPHVLRDWALSQFEDLSQ